MKVKQKNLEGVENRMFGSSTIRGPIFHLSGHCRNKPFKMIHVPLIAWIEEFPIDVKWVGRDSTVAKMLKSNIRRHKGSRSVK